MVTSSTCDLCGYTLNLWFMWLCPQPVIYVVTSSTCDLCGYILNLWFMWLCPQPVIYVVTSWAFSALLDVTVDSLTFILLGTCYSPVVYLVTSWAFLALRDATVDSLTLILLGTCNSPVVYVVTSSAFSALRDATVDSLRLILLSTSLLTCDLCMCYRSQPLKFCLTILCLQILAPGWFPCWPFRCRKNHTSFFFFFFLMIVYRVCKCVKKHVRSVLFASI